MAKPTRLMNVMQRVVFVPQTHARSYMKNVS